MNPLLASRPKRAEGVVFQSMPPDTVLLNLDSGYYYSVNPIGGAVWESCDGKTTLADILAEISRRAEVPAAEIERDVLEFVRDMAKEGLVSPEP